MHSRVLWLAACVALFGACIPRSVVTARVTLPALIPVRTFPSVWVVGGNFAEDDAVAEAIAGHIAHDQEIEVRRVDLAELEPARQRGEISSATVVLFTELSLREGLETNWDTTPVQSCGYYGCVTQYQTSFSNAPAVTGELVLTVYEGPTARVLQRERIKRSYVGEDSESARQAVIDLLIEAAQSAVDILNERVRVELYRTKRPEAAKRGLHAIELGHWNEGREHLERAKQQLGGLSKEEQAKVWYNLGAARRFAPGPQGLDETSYQAAKRAFGWALRLDPKPAHRVAIERLDHAYQAQRDLLDQQRARDENFRAVEPTTAAPSAEGNDAPPAELPLPSEPSTAPAP